MKGQPKRWQAAAHASGARERSAPEFYGSQWGPAEMRDRRRSAHSAGSKILRGPARALARSMEQALVQLPFTA